MKAIICEKPSAARNFERALGGRKGSLDGTEYEICALRGHTVEHVEPKEMVAPALSERYAAWSLEALPWDLSDLSWEKAPKRGYAEVLSALEKTLSRADTAVIACDVDPTGEGEMIAFEALEQVGWTGPVERMYFVDEAPESIRRAFRERARIPSRELDGDYMKALARGRWDFASMQFTRAASCIAREHGTRMTVRQGRLKSVMVKLVGDQSAAYASYVRRPYFEARFRDGAGHVLARDAELAETFRFPKKDDVDLGLLREGRIVEDSRTVRFTAPPRLPDLAKLSSALAAKGHKPDAVLETYQAMYESQLLSYPRTDDREMTPEQFAELLPLADEIARAVGVDPATLTHRDPRKTHVKEGGAHGANRPGTSVPDSLEEVERRFGKIGAALYDAVARGYLAMLAPDREYELVCAHIEDFPEYKGRTQVEIDPGYLAVLGQVGGDDEETGEKANSGEFGATASPYVHGGANKRPQRPTMKWLMARLERYSVGTGATRTKTVAEITDAKQKDPLLSESKGVLSLTDAGKVSLALLEGCAIATPEATERLLAEMEAVGRFERSVDDVVGTVTPMLEHDIARMRANAPALDALGISRKGEARPMGTCPLCGKQVVDRSPEAKIYTCESNKIEERDGKYVRTVGCGFRIFKTAYGKKLTDKQVADLLTRGKTAELSGLKGRSGKPFKAHLVLKDAKAGTIGVEFRDRKGKSRV